MQRLVNHNRTQIRVKPVRAVKRADYGVAYKPLPTMTPFPRQSGNENAQPNLQNEKSGVQINGAPLGLFVNFLA